MNRMYQRATLVMFLLNSAWAFDLQAGGSGRNVVVVVNQCSSNSCELGNYYCERRQVPPGNVLRICWTGGNTLWSSNDFQIQLLTPLLDMLAARGLTNQIDYVVLSMDIPFQTGFGATVNGTTSALFYGLKTSGELAVANSYAGSEAVFRQAIPTNNPGCSFLTTMITADTLARAKALVDQGVAGDGKNPLQTVVLAKSSDPLRNIRFTLFDNAIFNVNLRGVSSILRTNTDTLGGLTGLLGYETGLAQLSLAPATFVPGAVGDSMTSFGGVIFGPNSQTNLLAFIDAGAAGSYGTVAEPGTDAQKFPNPQVYFYQARGFTLAESYYQSVNAPYLGLMVAEPLAAPFARTGFGQWGTNLTEAVLSGTAMLSVHFIAANADRPLQQIDLFVDDKFFSTITNLGPSAGNILNVSLNGYPIRYTVSTNETVGTVAAGLAARINDPVATNATKVKAVLRGDRVELQCLATNLLNVPFYVIDTNSVNQSASTGYTVVNLPDTTPPRMIPLGLDKDGVFRMELEIPTTMPYVVQASTNLLDWQPIWTNPSLGLLEFQDPDSINYAARFYQMNWPLPGQPPVVSTPGIVGDGAFQMHVESVPGLACAILSSSNSIDWNPVLINQAGGGMDYFDYGVTNSAGRFYRAWQVPPVPPAFTVSTGTMAETLVRIDAAARPYTVEVLNGGGEWTPVCTNYAIREIQTAADSVIGGGDRLSTFLSTSRSRFLTSQALGRQTYSVNTSSPPVGAYLRFTITKTNGQTVVVGVTNQSGNGGSADLAAQLYALINTNAELQASDGVAAEDFTVNLGGTAAFNLRARNPGYEAAAIRVVPDRYPSSLVILPFSARTLTQNLSDLQARNHLYVAAGANSLANTFSLDTMMLADGHHQLTAVAFEGSHVRTQTRVTVPVIVRNSSLNATVTWLDLPDPAPVEGVYHLEVAANTNDVSLITLFSTGGALGMVTNEATATFEVNGTNLWAGLHPFYAVVETSGGLRYRTETHWVRLVNGP